MYKMNDIRAEVVAFDNTCVVATSGAKLTYGISGKALKDWGDSETGGTLYDSSHNYFGFQRPKNIDTNVADDVFYEIKFTEADTPEVLIVSLTGESGTSADFGAGNGDVTWGEKDEVFTSSGAFVEWLYSVSGPH